jgi:hypothetical protein
MVHWFVFLFERFRDVMKDICFALVCPSWQRIKLLMMFFGNVLADNNLFEIDYRNLDTEMC